MSQRPGFTVLEVTGRGARRLFAHESGGHRWQRVPPTERRGRRHTSTITVAVFPVQEERELEIHDSEIEWEAMRGSGKGGQAKQKTSNAVRLRHRPSGMIVRVEGARSQWQNRQTAIRMLAARLADQEERAAQGAEDADRRAQVGSGERGDKIRTIRTQSDSVIDHVTGRRTSYARYVRGHLSDLHTPALP